MERMTEYSGSLTLPLLEGERWWGGRVADGMQMPYGDGAKRFRADLRFDLDGNQANPVLLSNRGRTIWSEKPFELTVEGGTLTLQADGGSGGILLGEGYGSLRGAFLQASAAYFPPSGGLPERLLFEAPQYNLWIETLFEPTQDKVLDYARTALDKGLPPGVIMIDDNWHESYGDWTFHSGRFPDPRAMIDELHRLGFQVMLWICPFVSPDTVTFRLLEQNGYLLRDKNGETAVRRWWNGFGAVLDCTCPAAVQWLEARLEELRVRFGVDGFKFDAGDPVFYAADDRSFEPASPAEHCERWGRLGLRYRLNEFRACWKLAGLPLVQRLKDKRHSWGEDGLRALIPHALAQGLMGYAYGCPDMIGGGEYASFLADSHRLDEELFVRYAQCSALFPMMQFSAAPWRVLDEAHSRFCIEAAQLHTRMAPYILRLAEHAAAAGEPLLRHMEYVFPGEGYAGVDDQFMLGNELLVAPVLEKGAVRRTVKLPPGIWTDERGTRYEGPSVQEVPAPLSRLPRFAAKGSEAERLLLSEEQGGCLPLANALETRCLSSLTKVFADQELPDPAYNRGSALLNETYAFQAAYRSDILMKRLRLRLHSPLLDWITVRTVGLAPSELPCYDDHDGQILRATPGLYPDPLLPLGDVMELNAYPGQWRAVWVTVEPRGEAAAGLYPVELAWESEDGRKLGEERFLLELIGASLPEQRLVHTEWFHADCLATYYGTEMFSDPHWTLIGNYMDLAVRRGINMILTPLFTLPLDTAPGGERPTHQLVDVRKSGDRYACGFEKLERWIETGLCRGVRYFEFSHLFSQWGARHAPKIMAEEDGETKRIFGWETDALGLPYRQFLSQFLPELVRFIRDRGLESASYFHISDEPSLEQLDHYRQVKAMVAKELEGFPVIDAMSGYEYYRQGVAERPIPANDHIGPFLENGVPDLWTYYCCAQYRKVSNRFFAFPSGRNRIIGVQLYTFGIAGFLHWGYNFWYSQLSKRALNPYLVTDADAAFPSGDAFLVYPGEDGHPVSSIRLEVFHEALQDMRALELLESFIGKDQVMELLEEGLAEPLTFDRYPADHGWILARREAVNRKIQACAG